MSPYLRPSGAPHMHGRPLWRCVHAVFRHRAQQATHVCKYPYSRTAYGMCSTRGWTSLRVGTALAAPHAATHVLLPA